MMQVFRTSFSIPAHVKNILKQAEIMTGIHHSNLAMLCLKKLIKSKRVEISERGTVAYNPIQATEKIYVLLSYQEQANCRMIRAIYAASISYLLSISVSRFLKGVIRTITLIKKHNYDDKTRSLRSLMNNLKNIHIKVRFLSPQVAGISVILFKVRRL